MLYNFRSTILSAALAVGLVCSAHAQERPDANERTIRTLIQTFADARNAKDGATVANLYSEDGEWIGFGGGGRAKGREALAKMWGNLPGHVQRTVKGIDFVSDSLAVVRVETEYGPPIGTHHEVFVLVRQPVVGWKIRVHQTAD